MYTERNNGKKKKNSLIPMYLPNEFLQPSKVVFLKKKKKVVFWRGSKGKNKNKAKTNQKFAFLVIRSYYVSVSWGSTLNGTNWLNVNGNSKNTRNASQWPHLSSQRQNEDSIRVWDTGRTFSFHFSFSLSISF